MAYSRQELLTSEVSKLIRRYVCVFVNYMEFHACLFLYMYISRSPVFISSIWKLGIGYGYLKDYVRTRGGNWNI